MWWLDPGKEVLNVVSFTIPSYVTEDEILVKAIQQNTRTLCRELGSQPGELWYRARYASATVTFRVLFTPVLIGQLTLRNLRLKKGVLDKFQLPVDVIEGLSL